MLGLGETDEDGRARAIVMFDDDDLAGAMQELEDRFVAGEGAADAYAIRRCGDFVRSMEQVDGAATLGLCDPAVHFSDHRKLGFGAVGYDGVRGILAARAEQIAEDTSYFRTLEVRGDVIIGLLDSRGVSAEGTEVAYEMHWVALLAAGRMQHIDWYDPEDHAAAHARFEELAAADPRTPVLDNECRRVGERHGWLLQHDLPEGLEAATGLLAPDILQIDRRRGGVAAPDLVGRDARLANLTAVSETFGTFEVEHVAVRGDRLALQRWTITGETGFATGGYDLNELDETGRIGHITTFGDDDLAAALDFLDARHAEISGEALLPIERNSAAGVKALRDRDFDAFAATMEPGFTFDDRSTLGFGRLDHATYIEGQRALTDMVTGFVPFAAKYYATGRAAIATFPTTAARRRRDASSRGDVVYVGRVGESGLAAEVVGFDVEQWDEALALFDEWSGPGSGLSNRATRAQDTYSAAFAARDWDAMAASYADDIVSDDRRTGVNSGVTIGRAELLDLVRGLVDVGFTTVTTIPIAIRGERLTLVLRTWHQANEFDLPVLAVVESDADGVMTANVMFDAEDRLSAVAELERRYQAGEGAEHAGSPVACVVGLLQPARLGRPPHPHRGRLRHGGSPIGQRRHHDSLRRGVPRVGGGDGGARPRLLRHRSGAPAHRPAVGPEPPARPRHIDRRRRDREPTPRTFGRPGQHPQRDLPARAASRCARPLRSARSRGSPRRPAPGIRLTLRKRRAGSYDRVRGVRRGPG